MLLGWTGLVLHATAQNPVRLGYGSAALVASLRGQHCHFATLPINVPPLGSLAGGVRPELFRGQTLLFPEDGMLQAFEDNYGRLTGLNPWADEFHEAAAMAVLDPIKLDRSYPVYRSHFFKAAAGTWP